MNVQTLQQTIHEDSHVVRIAIDYVFSKTIHRVKKNQRSVNIKTFIDSLNNALTETGVRVSTDVDDSLATPNNKFFYPVVSALCFEPKDPSVRARIRLNISIHSTTKRLSLSEESWEFFRFRFLKLAFHELVHRAQYEQGRTEKNMFVFKTEIEDKNSNQYKDQKYLGELDEIEAYARDCYEEWNYFYPDVELTTEALKREFGPNTLLPSLEFYYETFKSKDALPVKRLLRKTLEWNKFINLPISEYIPRRTVTLEKIKEYNKTK